MEEDAETKAGKGIIMSNISRSAENSIKGYYYQFDYSIIKVLELSNDDDTICIEGVEDVDITDENNVIFHQCKCYESEHYVPSKIAPAIRQMLCHFAHNRTNGYRYYFYGTFNSGQEKYLGLSLTFIKEKICTYKEKGVQHVLYNELTLNDNDLEEFINRLTIDVNAPSYLDQEKRVIDIICSSFGCHSQEASLYYCNALYIIKQLATHPNEAERTISKSNFISNIKTIDFQFEMWLLHKSGVTKFANAIKKRYFSNGLNISPYNRFFIIECDNQTTTFEMKPVILHIAEKYSKLSQRANPKFCPFFCFYGLSENQLLNLKKSLYIDCIAFSDGYDFRGADFNPSSIIKEPTKDHLTKLRIIDSIDLLDEVFELSKSTIQIYQFYKNKVFYHNDRYFHVKIPFENSYDIYQMI